MELQATNATVHEFRETRDVLVEELDRIARTTTHYPVICTFAGYRFIFKGRADVETLIARLDKAIDEYETGADEIMVSAGAKIPPAR